MPEGLVLSLVSIGCLFGGKGMTYSAKRKISRLKKVGASQDSEWRWHVVKFVGGGICCIAVVLILIVLNNP